MSGSQKTREWTWRVTRDSLLISLRAHSTTRTAQPKSCWTVTASNPCTFTPFASLFSFFCSPASLSHLPSAWQLVVLNYLHVQIGVMSFGVVGKGKKLSNRNILRSPTAVSHPEQRLSYVTLFCISSRFSLKHRGPVNSCDPPMSPFDNEVLLEVLELHTASHKFTLAMAWSEYHESYCVFVSGLRSENTGTR